jgi:hypothetical protein
MEYLIALYLQRSDWQAFEEYRGASVWLSPHGDELTITRDVVGTLRELAELEGVSIEKLWRRIVGREASTREGSMHEGLGRGRRARRIALEARKERAA